jgi:hypothetical protein
MKTEPNPRSTLPGVLFPYISGKSGRVLRRVLRRSSGSIREESGRVGKSTRRGADRPRNGADAGRSRTTPGTPILAEASALPSLPTASPPRTEPDTAAARPVTLAALYSALLAACTRDSAVCFTCGRAGCLAVPRLGEVARLRVASPFPARNGAACRRFIGLSDGVSDVGG